MQWQGIKIHVVVVVLGIALATFLGAHWLYNSLNFKEPLKKELDNNNLVTEYKIEDSDTGLYQVSVTMKETKNLMLAYSQINNAVKEVMGNQQFAIQLIDKRDDKLVNLYYQGQFAIQEALMQGNFRDMADELNESATLEGVESKVFIDENNIYWQMNHGQYYLYEVIPRPQLSGYMPGDAAAGRG
ncbi:MAG: hypothetical protein VR67_15450 [Peptococcaceae bacterium BRH_c8a]|nr:MAG: hypothetical protein VR67_15450 [Peptococcaceae bacterium BRH_c8a]